MNSRPELVLGVESSCDEMAAAVVRRGEILSSVVHGQTGVHQPYGGVVPELASRDHVRAVSQVTARALAEAGLAAEALDAVAVTAGPGLVGSLLVGLSFAKALAYRLGIPVVGVHHLVGHLGSAELGDAGLAPPYVGLVISGGHTALYRVEAGGDAAAGQGGPALLGQTRDDAVGEAFDKVAKLLGLPYPGGPAISAAARGGRDDAVAFPRPMRDAPGLDFSFSGLKTAVALEVERRLGAAAGSDAPAGAAGAGGASPALDPGDVADLAAGFEAAAVEVLVARARRALRREAVGRLAVVGGVAANRRLRGEMERAGREDGFQVHFPPLELCTDNAAMIAAVGARLLARGERHDLSLDAFSRIPIGAAFGAAPGPGAPVGS